MARYIDEDVLIAELQEEIDFESTMYTEEQNKYFNMGLKCALRDVKAQPTADVVPRAEFDKLEYALLGVMHSVDKWLEGEELNQDEVNRAATMREKTMRIVEGYQAQIRATIDFYEKREKEIFEDLEAALAVHTLSGRSKDYADGALDTLEWVDAKLAEIKKRYTEGVKSN